MLNNRIEIFVPSTTDGNKPAKLLQKKETKRAAKYLSYYYGGATVQQANGYYISETKGLIKERQNIVYTNCTDEDLIKHMPKVLAYAKRLCRRMKQECITVTINGKMQFISL